MSFWLVISRDILCAKSCLCLEILPCNLLMRCLVLCQRPEPLLRLASWRCNWFNFSLDCFKNFGLSATKPFEPTTVCFELISKPVTDSKTCFAVLHSTSWVMLHSHFPCRYWTVTVFILLTNLRCKIIGTLPTLGILIAPFSIRMQLALLTARKLSLWSFFFL